MPPRAPNFFALANPTFIPPDSYTVVDETILRPFREPMTLLLWILKSLSAFTEKSVNTSYLAVISREFSNVSLLGLYRRPPVRMR
jgi:hypothetical protein